MGYAVSFGPNGAFSNTDVLYLSYSENRVMFKPDTSSCFHLIKKDKHTHILIYMLFTQFCSAYMRHRKSELLTPQGRHHFLVDDGVLRQHFQSPRQPHIQHPWCCPTATARCRATWGEGKGESEGGWAVRKIWEEESDATKPLDANPLEGAACGLSRKRSTEPRL